MQKKIIALVDCDSFFCSCERVFRPELAHTPVVVLSGNDGCVVSRSREAKALGVPMAGAYFKIKKDFEKQGGVAFSSNFYLYGDFSNRVMSTLLEFTPDLEVYSIDEAFLDLSHIPVEDHEKYCQNIRAKLLKEVGIPVSIGIAPTKVLAKLATSFAKKKSSGVFYYQDQNLLKTYPVENLWGIGKASAVKLKVYNIKTAYQLMNADELIVQNALSIVGRRIQEELRGNYSIDMEIESEKRQQIIVSRSFAYGIFDLEEIKKRLSDHVFSASEKMREEGLVCFSFSIFLMTNRFKDLPQYYNSFTINNSKGEDAPQVMIKKALVGLEQIFKEGYEYKKCGVVLNHLVEKEEKQLSFLEEENPKIDKMTETIDKINNRFGGHAVKVMSCSIHKSDEKKSKSYTTEWDDLKIIQC